MKRTFSPNQEHVLHYKQAIITTLTGHDPARVAYDGQVSVALAKRWQAGTTLPSILQAKRLIKSGRYPALDGWRNDIPTTHYTRHYPTFATYLVQQYRNEYGDYTELAKRTDQPHKTITHWASGSALPPVSRLHVLIQRTRDYGLFDTYVDTTEHNHPLPKAHSLFRRAKIAVGLDDQILSLWLQDNFSLYGSRLSYGATILEPGSRAPSEHVNRWTRKLIQDYAPTLNLDRFEF